MEIADWLNDAEWRGWLTSASDAAGLDQAQLPAGGGGFGIGPRPLPDATETTVEPFTIEHVEDFLAEAERPAATTDGDDLIRGTQGPDIDGNRGPQSDYLLGGRGEDSLRGGGESDLLLGSGNADTFIFRAADFDDGIITLDIVFDFDFDQGDQLVGDVSAFRIFAAGDLGPYGEGIMLEHTPTGDFIFIATGDTGLTLDQLFA